MHMNNVYMYKHFLLFAMCLYTICHMGINFVMCLLCLCHVFTIVLVYVWLYVARGVVGTASMPAHTGDATPFAMTGEVHSTVR